ncbi:MAG: hypothetical protein ACRCXZ_07820 [Patescibacteria group bacterium]
MTYQLIIVRENKLNNFFLSVQKNLPSFEICNPALFLKVDEVFNAHKYNTNFIFKAKSNSVLTYFFCRVNTRDQIILNTICKENECTNEIIKHQNKENGDLNLLFFLGLIVTTILSMDLIVSIINLVLNYSRFKKKEKLIYLNAFTAVGSIFGLLNFSILGFKIPFFDSKPILNFPPNVAYFFNEKLTLIFVFFTILVFNYFIFSLIFRTFNKETKTDYKTLEQIKF